MNATPIFELADILHTPQGVALAGAYSSSDKSLGDVLDEINCHIEGLTSIEYKNNFDQIVTLPVEKVQYTTSVGERVNIFLLLGHVEIPSNLIPGTPIYRGDGWHSPKINHSNKPFTIKKTNSVAKKSRL